MKATEIVRRIDDLGRVVIPKEIHRTMRAFNDIGYDGIMSIEYAHGIIPAHLVEDFMNLSFKTAQHIWPFNSKIQLPNNLVDAFKRH